MEHLVTAKTVVGSGDGSVLLEVRGRSVRIKRRGQPDLFLPLEAAGALADFFRAAARA